MTNLLLNVCLATCFKFWNGYLRGFFVDVNELTLANCLSIHRVSENECFTVKLMHQCITIPGKRGYTIQLQCLANVTLENNKI